MEDSFEEYLVKKAAIIDKKIKEYLPEKSSDQFMERFLGKSSYRYNNAAIDRAVLEPTWYLLGLGGKRWRPALMLLVIEALGKNSDDFLEFAMIPELVHNATLVHDDAEDDSPTRRGSPAIHVKYGLDISINLGDYLYYFPMVALMQSKKILEGAKNKIMVTYLTEMLRVSAGQATDIAWHRFLVKPEDISEAEYMQMVYNKTGVLARMACRMGAIIAGADDQTVDRLGHFGATIGVAFQLQDDLLNIVPGKLAKSKGGVGDDISEGKITLMVVHAIKNSDMKDKARLLEILSMHTKDKLLVGEAIRIIEKSGAEEYSTRLGEKIVMDAWNNVEKSFKPSEAKRRINQLVEFMVKRSI